MEKTLDISTYPRDKEGRDFVLGIDENGRISRMIDGIDLIDSISGKRIWSVGRRYEDGLVVASFDSHFYTASADSAWECIWLR